MVNILYGVIAFLCAVAVFILFNYCREVNNSESKQKPLLVVFMTTFLFCIVDGIWGVVAAERSFGNGIFLQGASVLFHVFATISAYIWYRYVVSYLYQGQDDRLKHLVAGPMLIGLLMICTNPFTDWVFVLDSEFLYYSGELRWVLFSIQYFYFCLAIIRTIFKLFETDDGYRKQRFLTILLFTVFPVFAGVLQFIFPAIPCYSMGYVLATVIVFTGNFSVEREKVLREKSSAYKSESAEIYQALKALGGGYVSIHAFDLIKDIATSIKSTPNIDEVLGDGNEGASLQIQDVMRHVCVPESVDDMIKFTDLGTLPERMEGKRSISREFASKYEGWCQATFIRVESDINGNPVKVLHAVQSINETKCREIEYVNTLKKMLEDKNVIYAEMLKMHSGGVIATDTEGKIILINDAAKQLYDLDDEGNFLDYLNSVYVDDKEKVVERYDAVLREGKSSRFYFSSGRSDGTMMYTMALSKAITLQGGQMVIITALSDISESKETEKELLTISETEALTGLYNRGSGEKKVNRLLAKGVKGLFCLMDINGFKGVNDTYGHSVGDNALVTLAECLKKSFRSDDVVFRLGGDEFAVFATSVTNKRAANAAIKRFFATLAEAETEGMNGSKVTVSLGAAFAGKDGADTFSKLYERSDSVMYKCKKKEGSNFEYYE